MKILLLGGTGAMGSHLVKILSDDKTNTVVVTSRYTKKNHNNTYYCQGDAHNIYFLDKLLNKSWDVIVDFMVYNTKEFSDRYKMLLSSTKQYIFLSSARVYASSNVKITETHPRLLNTTKDNTYLATDEYALSKARQEDLLVASQYKNWTIIRPYITFSESRFQLGVLEKEAWLYRAIKGRPIVFSKDMFDKMTTLTYGFDVAKGIQTLIGNKNAFSEVFHITNNTSLTWGAVLDIYLEILEKKLGFKPKVLLQDINEIYKTHPAKYQIKYDRLFDRQFNNEKIQSFINIDDFTNTKAGLTHCLSEFLNKPDFDNINWHVEAIKDKACNCRTPLTEIPTIKQRIRYLLMRNLSISLG